VLESTDLRVRPRPSPSGSIPKLGIICASILVLSTCCTDPELFGRMRKLISVQDPMDLDTAELKHPGYRLSMFPQFGGVTFNLEC
jgi:hypothetical protein